MTTQRLFYIFVAGGLVFLAAILAFTVWGLFPDSQQPAVSSSSTSTMAYMKIDNQCYELAVASTTAEKREGLSNYSDLPSREGMLFVYDESSKPGFWMKDMDFAIDIIWLNERNQVVTVKQFVSPDSYPKTFYPTKSAKNAIEVAAGTAESHNIKSGDKLMITKPTSTQPEGC